MVIIALLCNTLTNPPYYSTHLLSYSSIPVTSNYFSLYTDPHPPHPSPAVLL